MGPILKGLGMATIGLEQGAKTVGKKMLRTLYLGKRKVGKQVEKAATFAGKKGYAKTSKFITGARKKAHKASRFTGQAIRENPKLASFIGGGFTYKFLDDDK
jgi:hypothetical protein